MALISFFSDCFLGIIYLIVELWYVEHVLLGGEVYAMFLILIIMKNSDLGRINFVVLWTLLQAAFSNLLGACLW